MVMMSAVNILSGEGGGIAGRCGDRVQQCWQFEHPRRDLILDTTGESSLSHPALHTSFVASAISAGSLACSLSLGADFQQAHR